MFQIKGNEVEITGEICNEHRIKTLEFSQPRGPFFHYEPPTNETFGDHIYRMPWKRNICI